LVCPADHRDLHFSLHDALPICPKTIDKSLSRSAGHQLLQLAARVVPILGVHQFEEVQPAQFIGGVTEQALERGIHLAEATVQIRDRKSTRLNSSHVKISYAVFC